MRDVGYIQYSQTEIQWEPWYLSVLIAIGMVSVGLWLGYKENIIIDNEKRDNVIKEKTNKNTRQSRKDSLNPIR